MVFLLKVDFLLLVLFHHEDDALTPEQAVTLGPLPFGLSTQVVDGGGFGEVVFGGG